MYGLWLRVLPSPLAFVLTAVWLATLLVLICATWTVVPEGGFRYVRL